jgi:hypothetical protein
MSTINTPATSGEEIQRQMRQVRRELGEDVREIVENARTMTDWRHYVRSYPWVCLGAAALVGYLIVPARPQVIKPDAATLAEWAKSQKLVIEPTGAIQTKPSLARQLAGMAAGALLQGGIAMAKQYALQQLAAVAQHNGVEPERRERWS